MRIVEIHALQRKANQNSIDTVLCVGPEGERMGLVFVREVFTAWTWSEGWSYLDKLIAKKALLTPSESRFRDPDEPGK